jgi:preprotein translocase, SecE subunit, bacterial
MSKTSPAQFVRQVRQELKRITWATKKDTLFATITVLIMVVIASAFFFLVDLLLSNIVEYILSFGI